MKKTEGTTPNDPSASLPASGGVAAAPAILTYTKVRSGRGFAGASHLGSFGRFPRNRVFGGSPSRVLFLVVLGLLSCHAVKKETFLVYRADKETPLSLRVEVADTDVKRARGLMHRTFLPEGEGMLFVFPQHTQNAFWMKDTPLSLDLLFIRDGRIVHLVEQITPFSEDLLFSTEVYDMALEVPAGFSKKNDIHMGDRVDRAP